MTDDQALGLRLYDFIQHEGISQRQLAQAVKLEAGYVNQIFKGKKTISSTMIFELSKRFQSLSMEWLIRGRGAMYLEPKPYPQDTPPLTTVQDMPPDPSSNINNVITEILQRLERLEQKE